MNKDDRAQDDRDESSSEASSKKRRRSDAETRKSEPQIGRALRSVYDHTVGEAIPREMLDLLGRLD